MSVAGIHWAQQMRGVCPYKKAVLYALGERHMKDSGLCVVDQVMLAQDAGMTDRCLRKYLRNLEEDGLIGRKIVVTSRGRETHYLLRFERRTPEKTEGVRNTVPVGDRNIIPDGGVRNARSGPIRNMLSGIRGDSHEEHEDSVSDETAQAGPFDDQGLGPPKPAPAQPKKWKAESEPELATSAELQKAQIFAVGVVMLKKQKISESAARAFLGGLIKRSSVAIVARVINSAAADPPIDARAYLSGAVSRQAKQAGIAPLSENTPDAKAVREADRLEALDRRMARIAAGGTWQASWGQDPRVGSDNVPLELYRKHGIPPPESGRRRA